MAESSHGDPRRRPDIRKSGPVREHQPGSPLVGYADLDGEPAVIGAGVEAWRVAPEAHNAAAYPNCAGTRVLQSVQRAADPHGRSRASIDPGTEDARRYVEDVRSGHSESEALPGLPLGVPENSAADPHRPLHHESVP